MKSPFFDVGATLTQKVPFRILSFLILVFAPAGWPVLAEVLKAFFCMQVPGSFYSVAPFHHMNKFSVCQNTPKKFPNFDFLGGHKILSFLFEANFDPKKVALGNIV